MLKKILDKLKALIQQEETLLGRTVKELINFSSYTPTDDSDFEPWGTGVGAW